MPNKFLDLDGLKRYTQKMLGKMENPDIGVFSFNTRTGTVKPQSGDYNVSMVTGAVPNTRTINGKPLSDDITLTGDDIGVAVPDLSGYVPTTRTVNGKALSSNITLNAADIGVEAPNLSEYVPTTRKVNGNALSSDISLDVYDIGIARSDKRIGILGTATNFGSICIGGGNSHAKSNMYGVSIGYSTGVNGNTSIAVGFMSHTNGDNSVAMGGLSYAHGKFSVSIGAQAGSMSVVNEGVLYDVISDFSVNVGAASRCGSPYSIAIGYAATCQINAQHSIAIGYNANSNGNYGISIGKNAISVMNGISIGAYSNALAISTVAIGSMAAADKEYSTSVGHKSGTYSDYSTAIGVNAAVTSNASNSIAIGTHSRVYSNGSGDSDYSVAIGYASLVSTGAYCGTALGHQAVCSSKYSSSIGHGASCTEPNTIQLGDEANLSKLSCKVALSVTSDERDKTDITPIGDGAIEFLNHIKAIRYVFNGRELYIPEDENLSDVDKENKSRYGMCSYDKEAHALGTKKGERVRVGVLAQEVQKALQEVYGDPSYANLVDDNFFDLDKSTIPEGVENKLTMTYENFIPFLIKAIQELSEDNKAIRKELQKLKEG